jgi:hypothetical protein
MSRRKWPRSSGTKEEFQAGEIADLEVEVTEGDSQLGDELLSLVSVQALGVA